VKRPSSIDANKLTRSSSIEISISNDKARSMNERLHQRTAAQLRNPQTRL